ncbi:FxsB family cyclophane-forming radical SAM/SPASM peptide maturase [Nonomuraea maheshkhaliensis]|uniref:FxsB family cyclophane-forming radical SAM/SPASM peptide maturase n=1 Tax=Nonomuraea maheshkhaliensis TaxID=419590 RepID=UPI0031F79F98
MSASIVPFRQFVLKIASRCDLACDHCYVFEAADQSWRSKPVVMSDETIGQVARRIAEHARTHAIERLHVILHGGEPLLAGVPRIERIAAELRRQLDEVTDLDLRIHTNGVLLTDTFCRLFRRYGIKVGVSLDGDKAANDRHRRYLNGRSSHDKVIKAINLLRRSYPEIYAGILCTIDVRNDPQAVYRALKELDPPRIDFLLPHATWDDPPLRTPGQETEYADWLRVVHDIWRADDRPFSIRMFDSLALMAAGGSSGTESLGLTPSDLVTIETDGSYEQADSLKIAFDGAPATGLDAAGHSLDDVAEHQGVQARQQGLHALSATCRSCPIVESCGGGLFAHRYRTGNGFDNPSVFCSDLRVLIPHIQNRARPAHELTRATFERFAAATAGPADLSQLSAAQRSLTRMRVSKIGAGRAGSAEWKLLSRLDQEHRPAVDRVFDYPYVRTWARQAVGDERHRPYLASVAMTVALFAGIAAEMAVPARDGFVQLPGVGRMRVTADGPVTVVTAGEKSLAMRGEDGRWLDTEAPEWEPVRSIAMSDTELVFDDVDPYRDCFGVPPRQRLRQEEFLSWPWTFELTDELLRAHPRQSSMLTAGVQVITPLSGTRDTSHFSRQAFGAVGVSEPADPATLAAAATRSFYGAQLGALFDMFGVTIDDPGVESRLYEVYGALATLGWQGPSSGPGELITALDALSARDLPELAKLLVETARDSLAAR